MLICCFSLLGSQDEEDGEVYEIIETPGSRNLVEQLIGMDLAERPVVQQISIGGISGWYVNLIIKLLTNKHLTL